MDFTVFVKTVTGQRHEVKVCSSDTVQALKSRLQVQTRVPLELMRITLEDKTLEDGHKLSECGIRPKSVLYLWIRPQETGLTFTVKTLMGTKQEVHMDSLDPVKTLKLILEEITQCPTKRQEFIFNGRKLEDDHTLSAYGIQQMSVVHMIIRKISDVIVIVKTLTAERWFIDLDLYDTVENVKAKIQVKNGTPVDQMQLIFASRELEDGWTIFDYGIKHMSTVHLVLRRRGCLKEDDEEEDVETDKMDFTVFVKMVTGQRHEVKVCSSDTVQALKIQLHVQTRVPLEHMFITLEDKTLEDGHKLSECRILPNSILYLWIRPQETGLTFTVKTEMGPKHEVHMDSLDLVKMLKLILEEITRCPTKQQELMFNGRKLEDDRPLSAYGIQQASVVHMMIHKNNDIVVIVKTLTGKRWFIDFDLCDTVENMKVKIQDKEGTPIDQMWLIFAGGDLKDGRTVSDCGIKHLSIVHQTLRGRRGRDEEVENEVNVETVEEEGEDVGENIGRSISVEVLAD